MSSLNDYKVLWPRSMYLIRICCTHKSIESADPTKSHSPTTCRGRAKLEKYWSKSPNAKALNTFKFIINNSFNTKKASYSLFTTLKKGGCTRKVSNYVGLFFIDFERLIPLWLHRITMLRTLLRSVSLKTGLKLRIYSKLAESGGIYLQMKVTEVRPATHEHSLWCKIRKTYTKLIKTLFKLK